MQVRTYNKRIAQLKNNSMKTERNGKNNSMKTEFHIESPEMKTGWKRLKIKKNENKVKKLTEMKKKQGCKKKRLKKLIIVDFDL